MIVLYLTNATVHLRCFWAKDPFLKKLYLQFDTISNLSLTWFSRSTCSMNQTHHFSRMTLVTLKHRSNRGSTHWGWAYGYLEAADHRLVPVELEDLVASDSICCTFELLESLFCTQKKEKKKKRHMERKHVESQHLSSAISEGTRHLTARTSALSCYEFTLLIKVYH
jgi:hypothetical protein